MPRFVELAEAAEFVPDGATLGIGRLPPMALVRQLIRRGVRDLDLVSAPTGGLAEDLLIAAGAVRSIHTSGVDLAEHGLAPNFSRAAEQGSIRVVDSSCPALLLALQAGASGVSFAPVPGVFGSDLLAERRDWKVIEDPFGDGGRVVLVPAVAPEYAIIHALRADPAGNVVTTIEFDDRLLVQASAKVVVTVEAISTDATATLAADEQLVPAAYLDLVAHAPGGSLPIGCYGRFEDDREAIRDYLEAARDPATMQVWLDQLHAGDNA
jgi:glutaconate CoA-transferase subunit A